MFLAPARNRLNVVDLIGRVNFLIPSSSNGDRDGDIRERVREREREKGAGIENTVESGGTFVCACIITSLYYIAKVQMSVRM